MTDEKKTPICVALKADDWWLGIPQSPGRPPAFDKATEQRLRERFREEALRHKKHYGKLPGAQSKTVVAVMRRFADEEGVKAKNRTLRKRITDPVLRELKKEA